MGGVISDLELTCVLGLTEMVLRGRIAVLVPTNLQLWKTVADNPSLYGVRHAHRDDNFDLRLLINIL